MHAASGAKIVSARKISLFVVGLALLAVCISIIWKSQYGSERQPDSNTQAVCSFKIDNECVELELAADDASRVRGLSGRKELEPTKGMLFVFPSSGTQCMWMKDMFLTLDMLWLDADRTITHIEQNVTPDTYPKSFCGSTPAVYVIEVNGGVVAKSDLRLGQQINL